MKCLPPAACAVSALLAGVAAQTVPTGFLIENVVTNGLDQPTDFSFLPDGRALIANRYGLITVHAGASTTAAPVGSVQWVDSPYWMLTSLPSIAVDPGFATNGYVYLLYASQLDANLHLDRFTCTGALANPTSTNLQLQVNSRHVLLNALPDTSPGTTGGSVRFGPDGMLYVAIGDDAGNCMAQQLTSQVGCVLRLDVSGIPTGGSLVAPAYAALDPGNNPYSANTDFSQLVIGNGLHDPIRMEIDPATGNLYLGDRGAYQMEEVSEYVRPASGPLPFVNFGWPWLEGTATGGGCGGTMPPGLTAPLATMPQSAGWLRIIAGACYRNQQGVNDYGIAYEGNLFVADRDAGELRRLVQNGAWQLAAPVAGQPTPTSWGTGFQNVTSLRLGPDGALWYTQQQLLQSGVLRRIVPPGAQSSLAEISGDGQRIPAYEMFPQPLVVRMFDPLLNPVPGGLVDFTVAGGGSLSTTNPVAADASGFAQTSVTSTFGGDITVTASIPGSASNVVFHLFARRLTTSIAGPWLVVQLDNETDAQPPFVPYAVMLSFPGSPTIGSIVGPLCIDPMYALAIVIEDGFGAFGGVSLSGLGAIGQPGFFRQYQVPPGLFTGQLIRFQAVGFDPITGWFRTNCATRQF